MIPSLVTICQEKVIEVLENSKFHGRLVNDLCKYVPDLLLEPIFKVLLKRGAITDMALLAFLVPNRISLKLHQAINIRKSIIKQIGLNCPNLINLDLSDCSQVSNSVVRTILQGCPLLENIRLDRCHRITDSAFDFSESPFCFLLGCLSIEAISLQGCPQITGEIITTLNKHCRKLTYLNLSQCKNVKSPQIQRIFEHNQLQSLNLAFIDNISDEAFILLPVILSSSNTDAHHLQCCSYSPLLKLNLCKSRITDSTIFRMAYLTELVEIRLQWCSGITDAGIAALVTNCPKLRLIDLRSCLVTDEGLISIAEVCSELRELDLSWCQGFTDAGIQQLVSIVSNSFNNNRNNNSDSVAIAGGDMNSNSNMIGHNSSNSGSSATANMNKRCCWHLKQLNLEWCTQLTDAALHSLSDMSSLQSVHITGCVGITTETAALLVRKGKKVFFQ